MSDVLSKARAHFSNIARAEILVPEWADDNGPARFYAPALTLANRQAIERRSKGDNAARLILCVTMFLQNADGSRAFDDSADTRKAFETEIDPDVVTRIAKEIMRLSDADALGN